MNEMKQQWERTLREQEEQLAKAQEEIKRTCVQQQQLEEHIKETQEALGQANHEAIETTIQKIQEDTCDHLAQEWIRQEAELSEKLVRHEEELKEKTNEELREHENAILTGMDRRLQQEMLKLKAEKESKLTKMEQRFSRRHKSQNEDIDMDNNPTTLRDVGHPSSPYTKLHFSTPCFEVIKRIKKTRGISHRIHLVSVASESDKEEVPQEHLSEKDAPPHLQHNAHPATTMEDVIVRGVEATLRCVLIDKELPVTKKHSPWRRKMEEKELRQEKAAEKSYERDFLLGEVRHLFKDVFNISQDADFILHQAASHEDVYIYEYKDSPGPNCKDLIFDLKLWTAAQPKVTAKGGVESPAEVEQRLIVKKDETLKATCQAMHRKNKYVCRVTVLNHLIKHKTNENEEDLPAWQWLQQLVRMLGDGGMSSEESDVENDIETILCVKNMTWHCAIEWELDIINHQRIVDDNIFAPQGSKLMKQICCV